MISRKRTRLSKGVYRDKNGVAIIVSVHGKPREFRHNEQGKRYSTFTPEELKRERKRIDARESLKAERESVKGETLSADAHTFAKTFASKGRRRDVECLLAHWLAVFGDRSRHDLTTTEIAQQLAKWGDKPPATRRQLRQVLSQLYRTLDGRTARNPVADVPPIPVHYDEPRALPYSMIEQIITQMGPTQNAARLRVMAYTGLPQAQLARLTPRDVNLEAGTMYVKPRRKGGGAPGATFDLLPPAIAAFKVFDQRKCWGHFSRSYMAKQWREAVAAIKQRWKGPWPLPDGARAYDVRHSFLARMLELTGDYHAVNELAQHSTMNQTRRYTQGATSARVKAAITTASATFFTTTRRKKSPKPSTSLQRMGKPRSRRLRGK